MNESYKMLATAPQEIIEVLKDEIVSLGGTVVQQVYKGVVFTVDESNFYRIHLRLSTASSLFQIIKECSAKSEQILFTQAKRIKWHQFFSVTTPYMIEATVADRGDKYLTAGSVKQVMKNAVEDCFNYYLKVKPNCLKAKAVVTINVHILKQRATITLKTSGKSLHKRAYRLSGHLAPIKETLAASMLRKIGYNGEQVFFDPMCGSATIGIEAAYIALNKACNIHRKKGEYSFEYLSYFNTKLWRTIQDQERLKRQAKPMSFIYLNDINPQYVSLARRCISNARLTKDIIIQCSDFLKINPPAKQGVLVSNLPYGERLAKTTQLDDFYQAVGSKLKHDYKGWKVGLLVEANSPWHKLGFKPKSRIMLKNGSIDTVFLIFEIY